MASSKIVPTKYMLELKNVIITERKVSESTANTYLANLVLLNDKKAFNNLGFLKKNKELIIEHLSQYADSTEMNYLSAIVVALSTRKDDHLYKTIHKFYSDLLNAKLNIRDDADTTVKSEAQKENWLSWEDVEKKWTQLKEEVDMFKNEKNLSRKNFEVLVDFLVLSLYALIPPRRNKDYLCMWIMMNPKVEQESETKNYLDLENKKFYFHNYKTAKHYGTQTEDIPDNLMDVINIWVKHHPTLKEKPKSEQVKLFINYEGISNKKTLDNFITLRLNRIFGKKVASTMLRHIYITHKFGNEYDTMLKTAVAMGHSIAEQKDYIKKD